MIIYTDENPFELLEINGYHRYGIGDWSWVKCHKEKCRFHAIIDYSKETIRIHKDKYENILFKGGHKTLQKDDELSQEVIRIKESTFSGKLDLLKDKIFSEI